MAVDPLFGRPADKKARACGVTTVDCDALYRPTLASADFT